MSPAGSLIVESLLLGQITLGAREWLGGAVAVVAVALVVLVWAYGRSGPAAWLRIVCGLLKITGIVLLALCLLEPQYTGTRPRPGSNVFLVVADNSRSLQLADRGSRRSRGEAMQAALAETSPWLARLSQDFDVRKYAFDGTLRPVQDFSADLPLTGEASTLVSSLHALGQRFQGQPVAGILVLSDGNATDEALVRVNWPELPPIYPVPLGADDRLVDLAVPRVFVSQTNFDAAPVTIAAEIAGQSVEGRKIVVRVVDEENQEIERRMVSGAADGEVLAQRFLIKPEKIGISFYTVHAAFEGEEDLESSSTRSTEATLANNRRLAMVDRGGGPYRILYVTGRPNWEFKFFRRALAEDDEIQLSALVRVARKEPKFKFLSRSGESTNPIFRGFGNEDDETAEQYNQPVLIRFGFDEEAAQSLQGGFPQDAAEMFRYHAVVLDDIEAAFFTQDQMSLLSEFVSQRGGGLLMLGGKDSFAGGNYARTPIGDMLPVYLDRTAPAASGEAAYRLRLTREGWLQPWVRVRANERDEEQRIAEMPLFKTLNRASLIKPGASVLAEVESPGEDPRPALAVQTFGRGRVGALLVGDMWRWTMRRPDPAESDLEKAWRQTARWLVADVPQVVEVETRPAADAGPGAWELMIRARDKMFRPLDNAAVKIAVTSPEGQKLELVADSSERTPGEYRALFAPREAGAYRATISVAGADGSEVGSRETGWAVEPELAEFNKLTTNRPLLDEMARASGGEVVPLGQLDQFIASLPNRKIPVVEEWTYPLWHQWGILGLAVVCLVGEWGLRRWRGLP
jgi:uncharacterized membrane protein